jgi:small subunit ribosomal protein S17
MPENQTNTRAQRKDHTGVVVSKSGDKSIVVMVERRKRHERYGKTIKQFRKFHAHDESNTAKLGDRVRIVEARPMSRLKRWRLVDVVAGAKTA